MINLNLKKYFKKFWGVEKGRTNFKRQKFFKNQIRVFKKSENPSVYMQ